MHGNYSTTTQGDEQDYLPAEYPHGDPVPDGTEGTKAEDFARYSRALLDEQRTVLEPLHQTWIQNLLFLAGHHWWKRRRSTGEWGPQELPDHRERPVSNLVLAAFKTWIAKVLKNKPVCVATAASAEPRDLKAAELADQVIKAKQQEIRWDRILHRATAWAGATGTGYLMPYWSTETGRLKALSVPLPMPTLDEMGMPQVDEFGLPVNDLVDCPCDENGEPYLTEEGLPDISKDPTYVDEGDVAVRAYSPFQVYVNPEAEHDEDATWVIIADAMTLREIRERWPEADVKAEDVGRLEHYDRILSGVAAGGPDTQLTSHTGRATDGEMPKSIVCYYYEKQSPEYPQGRHWISAGEDVLLEGPDVLPDGVWPVVYKLLDIDMPGRWHGVSTLEAAVGLNREYNELNGWIKEAQKRSMEGAWVYEKGSGIKRGMLTNEPNLALEVNTGFLNSVKHISRNPVPADVFEERKRVEQNFETVVGLHRISMGRPPAGVTSGIAFLQLQEADDTDLGPFLARIEEVTADVWHACLRIIQSRYTEERLIRVSGPSKRHIVKAFTGSDLAGVYDVIPQGGSAFPWSKVAQQNMIMELANQQPGLFVNPDTGQFDQQRFAELLKVGGLESVTNEDVDVNEAHREESAFEELGSGGMEVPQVNEWQNHVIHIRCHEKVLKSAEFREWAPEAQAAFLQHFYEHRAAIQQAEMQAKMQAAGLTPPPSMPVGGGSGDGGIPVEEQLAVMEEPGGLPPGFEANLVEGMEPPPAASTHPEGYS